MALVDRTEKFWRLLAYGFLIICGFSQSYFYIQYEDNLWSSITSKFLIFTSILGMIYATLCIYGEHFVDTKQIHLDIPKEKQRRCNFCNQFKPERSHHCKICKRCILKMDHHCNVLSVCINYYNHGHFIRFLLFTYLTAIWSAFYNIFLIFHKIFVVVNPISYFESAIIVGFLSLSAGAAFITGVHLYWQFSNIKRNVTNVEVVQEHNAHYRHINCGPSPYNFGLYHNVSQVLGPITFLFLGPVNGHGYTWKKTFKTFYWPLYDRNEFTIGTEELI